MKAPTQIVFLSENVFVMLALECPVKKILASLNENYFFFVPDMSFSDEEDDTDEQVSIPGLDHPGALPMMGGHPMGATPPHLTPGNMSDHSSSSAHTLTPTPNKYETNNNSLHQQQPPMVSPLIKEEGDKDDLDMDEDLKGDDDKGKL